MFQDHNLTVQTSSITTRCCFSTPPENIRKPKGFLMFSGGMGTQHWPVMGQKCLTMKSRSRQKGPSNFLKYFAKFLRKFLTGVFLLRKLQVVGGYILRNKCVSSWNFQSQSEHITP